MGGAGGTPAAVNVPKTSAFRASLSKYWVVFLAPNGQYTLVNFVVLHHGAAEYLVRMSSRRVKKHNTSKYLEFQAQALCFVNLKQVPCLEYVFCSHAVHANSLEFVRSSFPRYFRYFASQASVPCAMSFVCWCNVVVTGGFPRREEFVSEINSPGGKLIYRGGGIVYFLETYCTRGEVYPGAVVQF